MWPFQEIFGWIFLALLITGFISLGMSYRILRGRRENMLAASLQKGCIGGLIASAIIIPLVWLVVWLGG